MTQVYIAGHMLDKGAILLRGKEKDDIKELGYEIYNPVDNKEINDKAKANPEGLAERIVRHDTDALFASDIIVIEPQPYALGTHVELGQILGMKGLADSLYTTIMRMDWDDEQPQDILDEVVKTLDKVLLKKVYPHMEDIRRQGQTEEGDRRSLGINQYVYGACLKLTGGKGLYEWEEITKELGVNKELF